MSLVLSLVGAASKAPLSADAVDHARRALDASGARLGPPDWLSPNEACDIPFEGDRDAALTSARAALSGHPLDVNAVPALERRKRLLVADMDSTVIEQECIDEMAALAGIGAEVAAITQRAMRGEIEFEPALKERVALLRGLPACAAERLIAERISTASGAAVLVATMRAAGAYTALVSGGFTAFAGPIAARLRFHEFRANTLGQANGMLTGALAEPVLGPSAKRDILVELAAARRVALTETLAIGDGANDIGMVELAGLGVAFRAKQALISVADAVIEHGDLTAVLFLQGYRRDQFVLAPLRA